MAVATQIGTKTSNTAGTRKGFLNDDRNLGFVLGVFALFAIAMVLMRPTLAVLVVGLSVLLIGLFVQPAQLLAIGVALTAFAGFWDRMGVPVPLHRVLLLGAIGGAFVGLPLGTRRAFKVRWRLEHLFFAMTVLWVLYSAVSVGTISTPSGQSGILDRLGLIPYLLFVLAPIIVDDDKKRTTILRWLVLFGAYFAVTALLEGLGYKHLAWPSYISDPKVGIQFDRARGPFVESSVNGLALFFSAVAGLLLARRTRGLQRAATAGVAALCLLTTVLTLTRSVWIGVVLASGVMFLSTKKLRRFFLPSAVAGLFLLVAMFQFVPGLRSSANERAGSQRSVWDRENLNTAAIAAVKDKPLTGVGWSNFVAVAPEYMWQASDIPLSGKGIDVHNFVLRMLAEIGLVGFTLWITTFGLAIGGTLVRRGPPELADWRWGLLGMTLMWVVVGALTPGEFSYPTFVLWMWAGITASPYLRSKHSLANSFGTLRRIETSRFARKFVSINNAQKLRSEADAELAGTHRRNPPSRKIPALTGLRFFAVLVLVGYHFRSTWSQLLPVTRHANGFLEGGLSSIDFLFLLSGFIIGWNYLTRLGHLQTREYVRFLWARLARIYPLHLLILALLGSLTFGGVLFGNAADKKVYGVRAFVENIFLVNSWRSVPMLTWNYPARFLSAGLLAYLLFPFCAAAIRGKNPRWVAFVVATLSVSFTIVRHVYNVPSDLARLGATFPLGVALAGLMATVESGTSRTDASVTRPRTKPSFWLSPMLVPFQAIVLLAITGFVESGVTALIIRDCVFLASATWLIATLVASREGAVHRFLGSKQLTYLGSSSFALFLIHVPVLIVFQRLVSHYRLDVASVSARVLSVAALIAALFLASHIGYRFVEEPLRGLLTGRRRSKRSGQPLPASQQSAEQ